MSPLGTLVSSAFDGGQDAQQQFLLLGHKVDGRKAETPDPKRLPDAAPASALAVLHAVADLGQPMPPWKWLIPTAVRTAIRRRHAPLLTSRPSGGGDGAPLRVGIGAPSAIAFS